MCVSVPCGKEICHPDLGGMFLPWLPPVSRGFTGAGQQRCLYPVTSESSGGTSGKKGSIVVTVTGRGGGSGETTGKYCLHVGFGSCPCARDSLLYACTMLLHRLLQAAPRPYRKAPRPSCFFVQRTLSLFYGCSLSSGTAPSDLAHFLPCWVPCQGDTKCPLSGVGWEVCF